MDFNLNEYHRNISDELLLEDVKNISKKIGRNTLTQNEYKKAGGKFGKNTFLRCFGSWNNVLVLCELKVNRRQFQVLNYTLIILFHGQKGEKQYLRIYRHYVANAILGKVI